MTFSVIAIAILVVAANEAVAAAIRAAALPEGQSIWLVRGIFVVTDHENVLSWNFSTVGKALFQLVVVPVALLWLIRAADAWLRPKSLPGGLLRTAAGLLLGGAVANGVELVTRGARVTDYLAMVSFQGPSLPVRAEIYNLGDLSVDLAGISAAVGLALTLLASRRARGMEGQ
ncbi:MAG: signal peptidase II [Candidatus Dormibacteria bacterium]